MTAKCCRLLEASPTARELPSRTLRPSLRWSTARPACASFAPGIAMTNPGKPEWVAARTSCFSRRRQAMDAATERLRNGASLQIRALLPSDRTEMLASIGRASKETLYRRFFAPKRGFSEREIEFFLNVDFISHVALAAVLSEGGRQVIVGGARYIVSQPGCAEVAFAIDDPHQKLGIA